MSPFCSDINVLNGISTIGAINVPANVDTISDEGTMSKQGISWGGGGGGGLLKGK